VPWVKVDDHFDEHPKHAKAGPLGWALWLAGLAYSNRNLTDGFIPWAVAQKLVAWEFLDPPDEQGRQKRWTISMDCGMSGGEVMADDVITRLLDAELWEECDGGYRVHDYRDYQPTKREVLKQRSQTAQRVSGFRERRRNARHNAKSNIGSNAASNDEVTPPPVPVPVPVPKEQEQILAGDSAPAGKGKRKGKPPDPNVRVVIDAYFEAFKAKHGSPPTINGGKCGAIAKKLLSGRSPEEASWLIRDFIANPPQFYRDKNLYGMEHILAAAPTLLARRASEPKEY